MLELNMPGTAIHRKCTSLCPHSISTATLIPMRHQDKDLTICQTLFMATEMAHITQLLSSIQTFCHSSSRMAMEIKKT